jgi:co-chaperonin GroES (HSP10)
MSYEGEIEVGKPDNTTWYDGDGAADLEPGAPGLPIPLNWVVLLQPRRLLSKTKGGILIPTSVTENQYFLNAIGRVLAMGPLAWRDRNTGRLWGDLDEPQIKPGDWLVYGRNAGVRTAYRGTKLLLLNDDEVLMRVADPADVELKL